MAKTLAFQRSTSQVVTIDTINNLVAPLGPPLSSIPTTPGGFPAKIENTTISYMGDPYQLVITVAGHIEVRKFNDPTTAWVLSSPSFVPISAGTQMPICLWIVNDKLIAIWTESAGASSIASAAYFDGTTWSARVNSSTSSDLDSNLGGSSVVWRNAVWFATKAGIGHFFVATGFGPFDTGFDPSTATPLLDTICTQGNFTFWDNTLYFLKPDTGTGMKLFTLSQDWEAPAPAPPQWSVVIGVTGILSSGAMPLGNDIGTYSIFVNKNDELSILHSGSNNTRLAKASRQDYPTFTDITIDKLPASLSTAVNLGISIYMDNRRRENEIEWFFFKDSAADSVTVAKWDGVNPVEILNIFSGADLLVGAAQNSIARTFTNLQPACFISGVNTTTPPAFPGRAVISYTIQDTLSRNCDVSGEYSIDGDEWFAMTEGAGDDGDEGLSSSPPTVTMTLTSALGFTATDSVTSGGATGTILSVVGLVIVVKITSGFFAASGPITDTTSVTSTTYTGAVTLYGSPHTFYWDAFADLDGTFSFMNIRMVPRISVSTNEAPPNNFVAIVEEGYLRSPATRNVSDFQASFGSLSKAYAVGEQIVGTTTGSTGTVQTSIATVTVGSIVGVWAAGDAFVAGGSFGKVVSVAGPVFVLNVLSGSLPIAGALTDSTSGATAAFTGAPSKVDVVVTTLKGIFIFGETVTGPISTATGTITKLRQKFNLSNTTGIIAATNTITGGTSLATGIIISVSLPTIVVDVTSAASFIIGETITTSGPGTAKVNEIDTRAVDAVTIPADETTDLEEFNQAASIANHAKASFVFQGRLGTNQTKLRSIKTIVRGAGGSPSFRISVFILGFGPVNQYTGAYATFTTLPVADTEIVIASTDLLHQPPASGKKYSVVVDFDVSNSDTAVCSTPFVRHE